MTNKEKLDAIRAEIHRLVDVRGYDKGMANDLLAFMDSLPNESISEDLKEAARDILDTYRPIFSSSTSDGEPIEYYSPGQMRTMFMQGCYWQEEHCLKGPMTGDLEVAADKYAIQIYNMFIKDETTLNNKEGDEILSDAFKAGALWKEQQMLKSPLAR